MTEFEKIFPHLCQKGFVFICVQDVFGIHSRHSFSSKYYKHTISLGKLQQKLKQEGQKTPFLFGMYENLCLLPEDDLAGGVVHGLHDGKRF